MADPKLNEVRVVNGRSYKTVPILRDSEWGEPGPCTGCGGLVERADGITDCEALGRCPGVRFIEVTPVQPATKQATPVAPPPGTKNDSGKPRMELLDSIWLTGVARVLTFGAAKYAPHNWRGGLQISRLLGACLRHLFAFLKGETVDPETGESHLYHASCCLMFAANMMETRPDMDDRYKAPQ